MTGRVQQPAADPSALVIMSDSGTRMRAEDSNDAAPSAVVKELLRHAVAEVAAGGGAAPVGELLDCLLSGH